MALAVSLLLMNSFTGRIGFPANPWGERRGRGRGGEGEGEGRGGGEGGEGEGRGRGGEGRRGGGGGGEERGISDEGWQGRQDCPYWVQVCPVDVKGIESLEEPQDGLCLVTRGYKDHMYVSIHSMHAVLTCTHT